MFHKKNNLRVVGFSFLGLMLLQVPNLQAETPQWLSSLAPKIGGALLGIATYYTSYKLASCFASKDAYKGTGIQRNIEKTFNDNRHDLSLKEKGEYKKKNAEMAKSFRTIQTQALSVIPHTIAALTTIACSQRNQSTLLNYTAVSLCATSIISSLYQLYIVKKKQTALENWIKDTAKLQKIFQDQFEDGIQNRTLSEEQAKKLISEGVNVNGNAINKNPPLINALYTQNNLILPLLLSHPFLDANITTKIDKIPAIIICAQMNNLSALASLLKIKTINVNKRGYEGKTVLFTAVRLGHSSIVDLLLSDKRIEVDAPDIYQQTALYAAVATQRLNIVQRLLAAGANPNSVRYDGATPLACAIQKKNEEIVYALLDDPRTDFFPYIDSLKKMSSKILQHPRLKGKTALFSAALLGDSITVDSLLSDKTIDVDAPDTLQQTALYAAVATQRLNIVQRLLEADANPNRATSDGSTPLSCAIQKKNEEIVYALLDDPRTDFMPYIENLKEMSSQIKQHPRLKGIYEVNSIFDMLKVMG